jgi:hypothetical protein
VHHRYLRQSAGMPYNNKITQKYVFVHKKTEAQVLSRVRRASWVYRGILNRRRHESSVQSS